MDIFTANIGKLDAEKLYGIHIRGALTGQQMADIKNMIYKYLVETNTELQLDGFRVLEYEPELQQKMAASFNQYIYEQKVIIDATWSQ